MVLTKKLMREPDSPMATGTNRAKARRKAGSRKLSIGR